MMHGTFTDFSGREVDFDLDLLKVVARGQSQIQSGWSGMLVYCPINKKLIELRSSPPNIRGDSLDEASEVDDEYACRIYGVKKEVLHALKMQSP